MKFDFLQKISFKEKHTPYLMIIPAVVLLLGVGIYPLLFSIYVSFHSWNLSRSATIGAFVGLKNFANVFGDARFWGSFRVTLIFLMTAVGVEFLIGLGVALLMQRKLKGERIIRSIIILPMMITPLIVGFIWRMLFNSEVGIVNYYLEVLGFPTPDWLGSRSTALWSIVVTDIWEWTPFCILILYA